jgi:GH24 family phage-related lysozyme (muramidase)
MHVSFDAYHEFSAPMEGRVPTMYCDILGLITTGVGNLINTLPQALALPWLLVDGTKADQADIAADWHKLHDNAQYYAARKWNVYAKTMLCHLSDEGIDALVQRQLDANEAIIRKRWPGWDKFPADAQLAIMSMAWAVGAGFYTKFPNLAQAIDQHAWELCVQTCKIREEGNPGVVPRNAKNRFCFHNAAIVKNCGMDVAKLHWPDTAIGPFEPAERGQAVVDAKSEAERTQRELDDLLAKMRGESLERIQNSLGTAAQNSIDDERDT